MNVYILGSYDIRYCTSSCTLSKIIKPDINSCWLIWSILSHVMYCHYFAFVVCKRFRCFISKIPWPIEAWWKCSLDILRYVLIWRGPKVPKGFFFADCILYLKGGGLDKHHQFCIFTVSLNLIRSYH
jgi:hypothetical protein